MMRRLSPLHFSRLDTDGKQPTSKKNRMFYSGGTCLSYVHCMMGFFLRMRHGQDPSRALLPSGNCCHRRAAENGMFCDAKIMEALCAAARRCAPPRSITWPPQAAANSQTRVAPGPVTLPPPSLPVGVHEHVQNADGPNVFNERSEQYPIRVQCQLSSERPHGVVCRLFLAFTPGAPSSIRSSTDLCTTTGLWTVRVSDQSGCPGIGLILVSLPYTRFSYAFPVDFLISQL